ncbi:MAG: ThiF family adenylyltransferase [Elusimicrobia bacterium]|nr:ThiF family adenylyltransferase [Elusimicrobiota bacterium]
MTDRYIRQTLFAPLGPEGQAKLRASTVSIVGLGALGCVSASLLARAGVGRLRLYDRDFVELDNLQRQILYDESDVSADMPKAQAAARHLAAINKEVACDASVVDVSAANVRGVVQDADLVIDGTDNFETRLLLNDACIEAGCAWVYAACVGSTAMAMAVVPGKTPCFRCLLPSLPPPGSSPTCDTAGILNAAAVMAASFQVAEAVKILVGKIDDIAQGLFCADLWHGEFQILRLEQTLADCPACVQRRFEYLDGSADARANSLCGRNAVQIVPAGGCAVDLGCLARRLESAGLVRRNEFLVKFAVEGIEITVFGDGRAIVKGTDDVSRARALYARYIGT